MAHCLRHCKKCDKQQHVYNTPHGEYKSRNVSGLRVGEEGSLLWIMMPPTQKKNTRDERSRLLKNM